MLAELLMITNPNSYSMKIIRNTCLAQSEYQRIVALRVEFKSIKESSVGLSASVLKNFNSEKQIEPRKSYNPNVSQHKWGFIRGT